MATRWTDVVWTDLLGRAQVMRVARDAAESAQLTVPSARLLAGFDPSPEDDGPELRLAPDWSTQRTIPWDPDVDLVIADLYEEDGPSPLCPRGFLKAAAGRATGEGYEVSAAVELEFYLVTPATGKPVYGWIDNYNLARVEYEPVIGAIRNELRTMAIRVEASNPEYSGGQFEVNLAHGPILFAADQGVLLRVFTGILARRHGLAATFLAKPWTEESGSGAHVHQSLWRDGENAFFGGPDVLSDVGRHYLAGLLAALGDLALLGSPTPNGYHRRADGSFAPTAVAWATDNRTAAVRAVLGSADSTRIEHRDGGADCNLYLTMGAQLLAGLDGMRQGLEPPPPITGNAYAQPELPALPRTFPEAYDRLRDGALAARLLPGALREAYLQVLAPEMELAIVSSADWERRRYAEVPLR